MLDRYNRIGAADEIRTRDTSDYESDAVPGLATAASETTTASNI